ncbi:3-oxoacid CoA-transferase subunit A [Variovorax paradoxus]|uniref:3-oxoacid CoA-transferase subunit A n=1 Tax=Variovorax paradoxus TaxID=34073 RepID=UPI003ED0CFF6
MSINKVSATVADALGSLRSESTVSIGGFGTAGVPNELVVGLLESDASDLTVVCNNAGNGEFGLARLLKSGKVRKIICSYPRAPDAWVFEELFRSGKIELELVPQGNLAERIRAAGAGLGGIYVRTGVGTELARGKRTEEIDGQLYVFERPIHADLALIKADRGDRWGNLTYRKAARNFGPVMAMGAKRTVAAVHELVQGDGIDPEAVITPGIFVCSLVVVERTYTFPVGVRRTDRDS